jgi:hypothetical protein
VKHTRIVVAHYGGPDALRVLEEECPEPDSGEVRVRVLAAGVALPDVMAREFGQLRSQLEAAKADYRDVLSPAEYPGYTTRMFRIDKLSTSEQQKIIDADCLLVSSFGAVFLALLPFALHESGIGDVACWRLSSAALATFTSISLAYLGYQIRRHRSEFGQLFSAAVFVIIATGSVLIVVLQLVNAVGLGAPPRSGSFLFGLLWLLFIAGLQFARILFVRGPGA